MIIGGPGSSAIESSSSFHDYSDDLIRVQLTLLDILDDVHADDSAATKLAGLLPNVLSSAISADQFLAGDKCNQEEVESIHHQVFRYLQAKDKYAALSSVLLKSRGFHMIQESEEEEEGEGARKVRPVVSLPRTQHKKPYIPISKSLQSTLNFSHRIEDIYPLSISHQHPFVGMTLLEKKDANLHRETPLLVGMDIVVFDEYNERLYSSQDEFLEVFQDYFTHREWSLIQAQQSTWRLQEFYIRWSMKEAYTKALGVGLGVDFSSFDLLLSGDGEAESSNTGVFGALCNHPSSDLYPQIGYMEHIEGKAPRECWEFAFLPLFQEKHSQDQPRGCACVCMGPLAGTPTRPRMQVSVQWTELTSLIEWHQPLLS